MVLEIHMEFFIKLPHVQGQICNISYIFFIRNECVHIAS